ncbi:MAG: NAD(P)H-binding protein [Phycisphaeraceae bacterium]|nr:NAD(P)H-binding protein [Phycisphaeraceae bacterium]QYK47428.1 MAG: NAD(P)H-binding protein [Phycisphaeraceae bacterium]
MSQMVVAVAGSTGFVGRHVVAELLSRGHRVRALARDLKKAGKVLASHPELTIVEGQAHTSAGAAALIKGADAIVNCVGIIRETRGGQPFEQAHVDVPKKLVDALREECRTRGMPVDAARFVQISALGVTDEDTRPGGATRYQRSKFDGEMIVRRSGFAWTVLRPGMIHGADGEFMSMARGWATGRAAPYLFMPYFARRTDGTMSMVPGKTEPAKLAPIFVGDVAWVVGESLAREQAIGEVYNLVGPEVLGWDELLTHIRDNVPLGKKELPIVGIPGPLAIAKARAMKAIGLDGLLPFDDGMAIMGMRDSVAESSKARQHLGFEGRAFRETMAGYAAKMV